MYYRTQTMKYWIDQELANHPRLVLSGYNGDPTDPNYAVNRQAFYTMQEEIELAMTIFSKVPHTFIFTKTTSRRTDELARAIEILNDLPANSIPIGIVIIAGRMLGTMLKPISYNDPNVFFALKKYDKTWERIIKQKGL